MSFGLLPVGTSDGLRDATFSCVCLALRRAQSVTIAGDRLAGRRLAGDRHGLRRRRRYDTQRMPPEEGYLDDAATQKICDPSLRGDKVVRWLRAAVIVAFFHRAGDRVASGANRPPLRCASLSRNAIVLELLVLARCESRDCRSTANELRTVKAHVNAHCGRPAEQPYWTCPFTSFPRLRTRWLLRAMLTGSTSSVSSGHGPFGPLFTHAGYCESVRLTIIDLGDWG